MLHEFPGRARVGTVVEREGKVAADGRGRISNAGNISGGPTASQEGSGAKNDISLSYLM